MAQQTVTHQAVLTVRIPQARILSGFAMPSSRVSSHHWDQTQVSHITGRFFTSEPPGKPKNPAVGSLPLLQGIFLTQESNWGLLPCRCILHRLSYQESPYISMCACAQSLQLCPTLYDPMDHGPPGSSFHGILQARILEWVAISFSGDKVRSE